MCIADCKIISQLLLINIISVVRHPKRHPYNESEIRK
jgi:hypothetical protein